MFIYITEINVFILYQSLRDVITPALNLFNLKVFS
jgi:hypothetical protein